MKIIVEIETDFELTVKDIQYILDYDYDGVIKVTEVKPLEK